MFQSKYQKNLTTGLFLIYLFLLVWLILFKFQINLKALGTIRNINLIPFSQSLVVNGSISLDEIIYNILVFVPLGIYLSILKEHWSLLKKILPCFGLSLIFETLQYIFAIGASDITDLIGNTLGGIIGIGIFTLLQQLFQDKTIRIINIAALLIVIPAVTLLSILLVVNS